MEQVSNTHSLSHGQSHGSWLSTAQEICICKVVHISKSEYQRKGGHVLPLYSFHPSTSHQENTLHREHLLRQMNAISAMRNVKCEIMTELVWQSVDERECRMMKSWGYLRCSCACVAESGIGRDGSGWGVHGVRGDVYPKCTWVFQGTIWKDGQRNWVSIWVWDEKRVMVTWIENKRGGRPWADITDG